MRTFVIVVVAIMLAGCSTGPSLGQTASSASPPPASAGAPSVPVVALTDAQKTSQMRRNVAIFVGADWYPVVHQLADGPDVVASSAVVTVATTLPQTDTLTAETMCHAVAAALTDDNFQPIGISQVVINGTNGQKITECQPL